MYITYSIPLPTVPQLISTDICVYKQTEIEGARYPLRSVWNRFDFDTVPFQLAQVTDLGFGFESSITSLPTRETYTVRVYVILALHLKAFIHDIDTYFREHRTDAVGGWLRYVYLFCQGRNHRW